MTGPPFDINTISQRVESDHIDPQFIPPFIHQLLRMIEDSGHSAYIVGGCVRDWYLGYDLASIVEKGGDFDITTSAKVEELKSLFSEYKQILDGEEFGTIKLYHKGEIYEITTFRVDGAYRDGRHPEEVIFSDQITDDLARRDFTINAMAASKEGIVIDPYDGKSDLISQLVKTVGDPYQRFQEDYLRMLRAIRFTTTLQFRMEAETYEAIREIQTSDTYFSSAVSSERKLVELQKTLDGDAYRGVDLLIQCNLAKEVLPIGETPDADILAALLSDLGKGSEDWLQAMAIILSHLIHTSYIEGNIGVIDQYLTEMATPTIDKTHLLNLVIYLPETSHYLHTPSSDLNILHFIWQFVSMYRQKDTHLDRSLNDLFVISEKSQLFDPIPQEVQDRVQNLYQRYPDKSSVDIHIDGREVVDLGFEGPIIGHAIELLRYYQPENKDLALQFLQNIQVSKDPEKHLISEFGLSMEEPVANYLLELLKHWK